MKKNGLIKIISITSNDLGISWGPAIHYLELWNELARCEAELFDVQGIAPCWTHGKPIEDPRFPIKFISVPNIKMARQVWYDFFVSLRLLFSGRKADLYYIRLSHWHFFVILALKILRKKYIVELNGLASEDSKSSKKKKIMSWLISHQEKALVESSSLNICVSDGIKKALQERYPKQKKAVTILNGVSKKFFHEKNRKFNINKKRKINVLYVGTFTPWDGAAEIINLASSFPDIRFIMVGDGEIRAELQLLAPDNVSFLGKVNYSELPEIYSAADAGIVLYEFERHKNVEVSSIKTLEYVASALPIFTTDIPGQSFVGEEGIGYLLSEGQDIKIGFGKFIENIMSYKASYKGRSAYFQARFGWESTAIRTSQHLKGLME